MPLAVEPSQCVYEAIDLSCLCPDRETYCGWRVSIVLIFDYYSDFHMTG